MRASTGFVAVLIVLVSSCSARIDSSPPYFDGAFLFDDVSAYDSFGVHQTATAADLATASWQRQHLERLEFRVDLDEFRLRQQFPSRVELAIGGEHLQIKPQWPITFSSAVLEAPLVWVDDPRAEALPVRDKIAALSFAYSRRASINPHLETIRRLFAAGALAVIGATEGPTGEIISLNTLHDLDPFPGPVVLARAEDAGRLRKLAIRGSSAKLRVEGETVAEAVAQNVIGRLDRGESWTVPMSPDRNSSSRSPYASSLSSGQPRIRLSDGRSGLRRIHRG
jgi:hypothetical protein